MRAIFAAFVSVFVFVTVTSVSSAEANFSAQFVRGKKAVAGSFPLGPDSDKTPGKLCDTPSELRYPEKVPYCSRSVSTSLKKEIIAEYDSEFGYQIQTMSRAEFKIDHFFPLCAGGSNDKENLWPQHSSVYKITDPLEPELCAKMAQGRLKQEEAIELVIRAKLNLDQAPEVIEYVRGL